MKTVISVRFMRLRFLLFVLLASALPLAAQTARSGGSTKASAPAASNSLPLVLGAAIGGLIIGAVLGMSQRKAPVVAPKEEKDKSFDDAPFPLAVIDGKERITRANPAFAHFFGGGEVTGQPLPPLLHPDDLAPFRVHLHSIYDGDVESFEYETRFFRPDGALRHTHLTAKKADAQRKPQSVMVSLQDTTRLVEAETELSGARDAIHALYEVIAGEKSRDLDAKMKSLLAMGCGRLHLPIGVLGRFNQKDGQEVLETLFVQSPDRRVRPAMQIARTEREGVEAQLLGLATLPHPGNWEKQPFIVSNGSVTYLGAPVVVEGKLYGMLSFASIERREGEPPSGDIELLQLMAEWVGGEIERENARIAIETQQSQLIEANEKLEALATHDSLTEAKNRRAFNDKLDEEWSRATRYGTPLSLVMLDVDKFKLYNDSFGHQAGDEVLRRVAHAVMAAIRGTDFFARYGGEEFALILPNTDAEGALVLAERLRSRLEASPWKERPVTASLGVASLDNTMKKAEELTGAADAALYASKERGRNRVTHAEDLASQATDATPANA